MKIIGSNKGELLSGTGDSDVIYGNKGSDHVFANGSDIIMGTAREQVFAGQGNDFIGGFSLQLDNLKKSASYGSTIDGGSGIDTLFLGIASSDKIVYLDNAARAFRMNSVEDIIYCVDGPSRQRVFGTDRGETIVLGDTGLNVDGRNGNDYIFAKSGNDTISGGNGNDFIHAGEGHNIVRGGAGVDFFHFYFEEEVTEYTAISDFRHGVDKFVIQYRFADVADDDYPYDIESPEFGEAHQFVNFDGGREIDRATFHRDSGFFSRNVEYERETGSVLLAGVLIAHIDGSPKMTESDFLFAC